jgi:tetratricopeptide (TPR) repeat protein
VTAVVILLIVSGLGYLTMKRNYVWLNSRLFWEDVVRKSPNKARGYISLANAYKADGNLDFAIAAYSKGVSLSNNIDKPYFMMALALAYAENGQHDRAKSLVQEAFEIAPAGSPEIFYIAGNIYERSDDDVKAIEHYKRALQKDPRMLVSRNQLGSLFHRKGMLKEAIAEYESAIDSDPYYAPAYNEAGIIYAKTGNLKSARTRFEQALRLKPNYTAARKNLEHVIRLEAD